MGHIWPDGLASLGSQAEREAGREEKDKEPTSVSQRLSVNL